MMRLCRNAEWGIAKSTFYDFSHSRAKIGMNADIQRVDVMKPLKIVGTRKPKQGGRDGYIQSVEDAEYRRVRVRAIVALISNGRGMLQTLLKNGLYPGLLEDPRVVLYPNDVPLLRKHLSRPL